MDVRDDDFLVSCDQDTHYSGPLADEENQGGNIVNCLRAPSRKFHENLDELVEQTKEVPKVIFHCALSQER